MVKNTMGGCNGKKVAHKHAVKSTKSGLRISQNKSEIYGVVKRLNGNTFDVTCIDDKERRCFIRGKFKGRGKRDNIIEVDKWVLIGLREFQQVPSELVLVNGKKEMEMCDLLEVYSSSEKETLKRTHGVYMKESEIARSVIAASEDTLQFVDMDTLRYQNIASQKVETIRLKAEQRKTSNNLVDQSAFYSDIESDEDDDDDHDDRESSDGNNKNDDMNKNKNDSSGESEEEEEEESKKEKQNTWNKNKRVYKEEIDVDDI
jgi:translation initiation factor IF-1